LKLGLPSGSLPAVDPGLVPLVHGAGLVPLVHADLLSLPGDAECLVPYGEVLFFVFVTAFVLVGIFSFSPVLRNRVLSGISNGCIFVNV
jgi:hypothetical protein